MIRLVEKMLAPLKRRVDLMLSRAIITLVNDDPKLQGLQITLLAGEVADDIERFQEYGFSSVPEKGAEAIALAVGGNRNHLVVVATDDRRYRPTGLQAGDVVNYNSAGAKVLLRGPAVLIGAGDNSQALGDGVKAALEALIDQVIILCTAQTTMGTVLGSAPKAELVQLKAEIGANTGTGEIISDVHKTSKG